MSKKKNKKGSAVQVNNLAGAAGLMGGSTESVGFESLIPTPKGQEKLNNIHKRRGSKLTSAAGLDAEALNSIGAAADKPEPKPFDLQPMSNMLDELEDLVKAGKYKKAMDVKGREKVVNAFISFFGEFDPAADNADKVYGMVRKLLSIAKSFYEYDSDLHELIPNATYDGLLAKYLAAGKQEPVGIVPKGSKNLHKAPITYPALHNNVDKAYAIRESDKIPEGVKESDKVEAFLMRTFKALGLSPENELTLEISPKIDGVSVNGTIGTDMMLRDPQTRGDNEESVKVMGMNGMTVSLDHAPSEPFGLQYEVFVTEKDRIAASNYLGLETPYVSCRHAAAGIIHRLSTTEDDELLQYLSLYPIATEGLDGTYLERMAYIQNFSIMPKDMLTRLTITGCLEYLLVQITDLFIRLQNRRENLSYAIDGLVMTVVDDEQQETLGREGRTNKFQLALKFDPANAEAEVSHIELDTGRKGFRTPQVYLKHPVFLDGVRYDHVPVLSANLFDQMNLRVGSTVNVHRVGDVIPSISVIREGVGKRIKLPDTCPDCGRPLTINNKKLYCSNVLCPGNIVGRFSGFFAGIGMEGYNDAFSAVLHETMGCSTIADIMKLVVEDFKAKNVTSKLALEFPATIQNALEKADDYTILGAMGLYQIGNARAKALLRNTDRKDTASPQGFLSRQLTAAAHGIVGPNQVNKLTDQLESEWFRADFEAVKPYLLKNATTDNATAKVGHTGGKLSAEVLEACKQHNLEVVDGKSFDILITSSMDSDSAKMEVARKKSLPIFLEKDFLEKYPVKSASKPAGQKTTKVVGGGSLLMPAMGISW